MVAKQRSGAPSLSTWLVYATVAFFILVVGGILLSVLLNSFASSWFGGWLPDGYTGEWYVFAAEEFNLTTSPFSSSFFVLTGFHGLHVALGILMLLAMWTASMMGRLPQQLHTTVENIGLYWHFVDIVWIIIFTVVYLIPAATTAPAAG